MTKVKEAPKKLWKSIKTPLMFFVLGAIVTALYLDNRAQAMVKAFQNPVAVNATNFQVAVDLKK